MTIIERRGEPRSVQPQEQAQRSDLAGRHICVLISSLGAGGAERVVALLSRHWLSAGAHVTILSFESENATIYHDFAPGVCFHRLGEGRAGGRRVIDRVRALRHAISHDQPDLLISFLTKINLLALVATMGSSVPVIVAERNNPDRQPVHIGWRIGLSLFYRRAAAVICQTKASVSCLPCSAARNAWVIPNPVATPREQHMEKADKRLVAVGRLTHQKGFDLLIDAFAQVADKHRDWKLDIWGEGPDELMLTDRISRLGLSGRIALRGLSAEPGGWIAEANAFVLPSRYEGFPNVLAEALAAGLPVLAADCAFGPAEMVRDGENGLLVEPESVEALAHGIDILLQDSLLRMRLGVAARGVAEQFSAAKIAALWDAVLVENLAPHR
ncbi:MAG: glycosyltransferase family 4 protein [Sphingomonadales bacterium]|nr:glycosyltransferase family 4 protein [Sphingomonadales bacterium]